MALKRERYSIVGIVGSNTDYLVPRILVVASLPRDLGDWLQQSEQQLALRHCGYRVSLRGEA